VCLLLFQAREKFLVDLTNYGKFSEEFGLMSWAGQSKDELLATSIAVVNRAKASKFEAFIIMICYKNQARNKLKSLQKAEAEFATSKQNPSQAIHPKLWAKVLEVKRIGK
jgi:hypothetical protein